MGVKKGPPPGWGARHTVLTPIAFRVCVFASRIARPPNPSPKTTSVYPEAREANRRLTVYSRVPRRTGGAGFRLLPLWQAYSPHELFIPAVHPQIVKDRPGTGKDQIVLALLVSPFEPRKCHIFVIQLRVNDRD
jgi:hypothetical protein